MASDLFSWDFMHEESKEKEERGTKAGRSRDKMSKSGSKIGKREEERKLLEIRLLEEVDEKARAEFKRRRDEEIQREREELERRCDDEIERRLAEEKEREEIENEIERRRLEGEKGHQEEEEQKRAELEIRHREEVRDGDDDKRQSESDVIVPDDFFQLAKNIPGFVLDETRHSYYVRGKITQADHDSFHSYAKAVETLTLRSGLAYAKRSISPQVFLRLAQLQSPNGFLLPSLHHLRVVESTYLDYLELFISPSLKTLEIGDLSLDVNPSSPFMSFLAQTVEVSPGLETIVLGPHHLFQEILASCMKFKHLRHLEMFCAPLPMIDSMLNDVGSLEYLEELVLQESTHMNSPTKSASPVSTSENQGNLFHGLKTLIITATLDLVEKVIRNVTSRGLRVLSLTVTQSSPSAKMTVDAITIRTINLVAERWGNKLVSVNIKALDSGQGSPSLPPGFLRDLLCQPQIQTLEITGFNIPAMDSEVRNIDRRHLFRSELQVLHLPTRGNNHIPLPRLRDIAEAFPNLSSLRCVLDIESSIPPPMDPLAHQLRALSVTQDFYTGPDQHGVSLRMPAYIDCLFPNLVEMEVTSVGPEPCVSVGMRYGWLQVFDMVRVFQTVRANERKRLGVDQI